jgi:hypothetical protein
MDRLHARGCAHIEHCHPAGDEPHPRDAHRRPGKKEPTVRRRKHSEAELARRQLGDAHTKPTKRRLLFAVMSTGCIRHGIGTDDGAVGIKHAPARHASIGVSPDAGGDDWRRFVQRDGQQVVCQRSAGGAVVLLDSHGRLFPVAPFRRRRNDFTA